MRILLVAMPDSIHTMRWVSQFSDKEWEIYLFPSTSGELHFKGVEIFKTKNFCSSSARHKRKFVKLFPNAPLNQIVQRIFNKYRKDQWREKWLLKTIKSIKPDIIHSLEFQSGAYLTHSVKGMITDGFPPWIATNWGCDVQIYSQLDGHREKIIEILKSADYYSAECARDYEMVKRLGFTGENLPVLPNAGGLDLKLAQILRSKKIVTERNLILVKGYQGMFGRALDALKMIKLAAPDLPADTKVFIYSASPEVEMAAEILSRKISIEINCQPITTPVSHHFMMDLFSRARVYLGISIADGISTSLLEAMACGAFPIQTCTACADEWIQHELSGFIVEPEKISQNAEYIVRAMVDDDLVNRAYKENWKVISDKAEMQHVAEVAATFYDIAFKNTVLNIN